MNGHKGIEQRIQTPSPLHGEVDTCVKAIKCVSIEWNMTTNFRWMREDVKGGYYSHTNELNGNGNIFLFILPYALHVYVCIASKGQRGDVPFGFMEEKGFLLGRYLCSLVNNQANVASGRPLAYELNVTACQSN